MNLRGMRGWFQRDRSSTRPRLTLVVNFYEMAREAPRTLYSLSAKHQRGVRPEDYDVVAIDNGSSRPLRGEDVRAFGPNFRSLSEPPGIPSPLGALNRAVRSVETPYVLCIIDGARL